MMSDLVGRIDEALDGAEQDFQAELQAAAETEPTQEPEPEAEADEPQPEPEDQPEEVASDDLDEDVEDEGEDTGFDWNRVDELPVEKLPPKIAKIRSDRDRLASEIGELKKQLAEMSAKQKVAEPEAKEEGPPEIDEDDDAYTIAQKIKAIASWEARQASREVQDKLKAIEEKEQQAEQMRHQQFFVEQATRIEKASGYSQDVGDMMSALVGSNPGWREALGSPQGWDQLFGYAQYLVKGQVKKTELATKKATAREREVPRKKPSQREVVEDLTVPGDLNVEDAVGSIIDQYKGQ